MPAFQRRAWRAVLAGCALAALSGCGGAVSGGALAANSSAAPTALASTVTVARTVTVTATVTRSAPATSTSRATSAATLASVTSSAQATGPVSSSVAAPSTSSTALTPAAADDVVAAFFAAAQRDATGKSSQRYLSSRLVTQLQGGSVLTVLGVGTFRSYTYAAPVVRAGGRAVTVETTVTTAAGASLHRLFTLIPEAGAWRIDDIAPL